MAKQRQFRFGAIAERAESRDTWLNKARRIEDLGYNSLLVPDHIWIEIDPVVALMAAADHTALRIGSHVFSNDFRNPVLLARQAATLDMLSNGRFQFGLGCGYDQSDYDQAGIVFGEAGERVSRFEEALRLIKEFFTQDVVTFSGEYYQTKELKPAPKSVQKPHPPIYIGGSGKRVLSIAGREADIIGVGNKGGPATVQQKLDWIRSAAGERFEQIELSSTVFAVAVTEKPEYAAQTIAQRMKMTTQEVFQHLPVLVGTVEQIAETLLTRRERYGISSIDIIEPHMEAFAPVIPLLVGK
jgi:probable F420-dependent oxidoreductase